MSGNDFAASLDGPVMVHMVGVERRGIDWIWPGRLAKGKLTLLIGEPDMGKSLISVDWAARLSRGVMWPDGEIAEPGNIIFMTSEDGIADTVAPRLDAAGADCARIQVLRVVRREGIERMVTLANDLDMLEAAIRCHETALLIGDPFSAYLGDADSHKDAALRGVLSPFADLLERTNVACLGVMHPPRHVVNLIYFASGSGAFTAQARVVLGAGKDPNDERGERRLLVKIKGNLYREVPTLGYRIMDQDGVPVIAWESKPVEGVTAHDVLGLTETKAERSERKDAMEFLRDILQAGPTTAKDVYAGAEANGISRRTLERAKRDLGVKSDKLPDASGKLGQGPWYWSLPAKTATKVAT
ncbi:MAG: AAA family ATPase [Candidatus Rokuibacteriota bacterium]